jgi:hypothetical protein
MGMLTLIFKVFKCIFGSLFLLLVFVVVSGKHGYISFVDNLTLVTVLTFCFHHWLQSIGMQNNKIKIVSDLLKATAAKNQGNPIDSKLLDKIPDANLQQFLKAYSHPLLAQKKDLLHWSGYITKSLESQMIPPIESSIMANSYVGLIGTVTGIFLALNVIDPTSKGNTEAIFAPLKMVMLSSLLAYLFNFILMNPKLHRLKAALSQLNEQCELLIRLRRDETGSTSDLGQSMKTALGAGENKLLISLNSGIQKVGTQLEQFNVNFEKKIDGIAQTALEVNDNVERINNQYILISESITKVIQHQSSQEASRVAALQAELDERKFAKKGESV